MKLWIGALALLALPMATFSQQARQEIRVTVNGEDCDFDTAYPFVSNGHTLTPVRGVFEKIGARVDYNPETKQINAYRKDLEVVMKIGSKVALVNGEEMAVSMPPRIVSGSTMVPLRFLTEALGGTVSFNPKGNEINIYVPDMEKDLKGPISDPPRTTTGGTTGGTTGFN